MTTVTTDAKMTNGEIKMNPIMKKTLDDGIKIMVDRFLSWKLPENFNPDHGISYKKLENKIAPDYPYPGPTGTNLFDAQQAEEMIRYIVNVPKDEL